MLRRLLALLPLAALWFCAGPSEFSTAEMLRPGGWEAGLHASGYGTGLSRYKDDGYPYDVDWIRPIWSAGASAAIGLTERLNLLGAYDYSRIEGSEPRLPLRDQRLALALKYGLNPSREAVSLGLGYHPVTRIYEINAAFYYDWHFAKTWYYCFAPAGAYYGGRNLGFGNIFPHVILDQSVTWNPAGTFFLRPQIGIDFGAFISDVRVIHFGLATGF